MIRNASLLTLALSLASLVPAVADEIITRRTIVTPAQSIYIPSQTVISPSEVTRTTRTTTVTTPGSVCLPAAVITPDTTTSSRTTIMMSQTAAPSTTSTAVSASFGPFPVYSNRLAAMNDQIANSLAHGWITQAQADALMADHDRLSQIISNRSSSLQESDGIERQLNALNLSIQGSLNASGRTAGLNSAIH